MDIHIQDKENDCHIDYINLFFILKKHCFLFQSHLCREEACWETTDDNNSVWFVLDVTWILKWTRSCQSLGSADHLSEQRVKTEEVNFLRASLCSDLLFWSCEQTATFSLHLSQHTHAHTRAHTSPGWLPPSNLTMVLHSRPAINQWAGSCLPVRLNKSICEDLLSLINHLDSSKNTFPL